MELEKLREDFKKLPDEQAASILNIIEHKTDNDMKEIIAKMDSQFNAVNSEFKSMRNEIRIVYWVIGVTSAILTLLLAVIALRK